MWPFTSKKKTKETKTTKPTEQMTSAEVRAQALAQFRKTEAELGQDTIQEMKRQLEYEAAKKSIHEAIEGKGEKSAEDVLDQLNILLKEDKRRS